MSPTELKLARQAAGLTQPQAAARLGISQPYLALLERGRRRLTEELMRKFVRLYRLPPTALPLEQLSSRAPGDSELLAACLSGLGYPGFSYLRPARRANPASVLLAALSSGDLEVRLIEALPWLVLKYSGMDWEWLLKEARQREIQNRLGFVISLARSLAARHPGERANLHRLVETEAALDRARLVREDTLCQQSLSPAERRWLRRVRPPRARHWNLLTDLTAEALPYAA
jgi:transcriptional regulator with XRE-family HTH domain